MTSLKYNISIFYRMTSHCCDFFHVILNQIEYLAHKSQRKILQVFEPASNIVVLCLERTKGIIILVSLIKIKHFVTAFKLSLLLVN